MGLSSRRRINEEASHVNLSDTTTNQDEKLLRTRLKESIRNIPSKSWFKNVSLVAGMAAAPLGIGVAIWAMKQTPDFNIFTQTVSHLFSGPHGEALTASFVGGAVLAVSAAPGFYELIPETKLGKAGIIALAASTVALGAAAIAHPPNPAHEPLAATYFVTAVISLGLIGYGMIKKGLKKAGAATMVAAAVAGAVLTTGVIKDHGIPTAVYEMAGSIIPGAWMTITSAALLAKASINYYKNRDIAPAE